MKDIKTVVIKLDSQKKVDGDFGDMFEKEFDRLEGEGWKVTWDFVRKDSPGYERYMTFTRQD